MLLRKSFADAHITLICGPWNVGLARRLEIADEIYPVDLFAENSLGDMDRDTREQRRREAIDGLRALALPRFDLAIDLRRDEDTRALLKIFEADVRAGFGDLLTYSYLDVALPVTHRGFDTGMTSLSLRPCDLEGGMGHTVDEKGLCLSGTVGRVDIELSTDAVWAPSDEGFPDNRPLGAALRAIHMRQSIAGGTPALTAEPLVTIDRSEMAFGPGWLDWEPWGRWTTIGRAPFNLLCSTSQPKVDLLVEVQGHTGVSHTEARVWLTGGGGEASHLFKSGDEPVVLAMQCELTSVGRIARSAPFLLRAGRYRGVLRVWVGEPEDWVPLTLTIGGARPGQVVARISTAQAVCESGLFETPFEIELVDSAEPIRVEVAPAMGEGSGDPTRLRIASVELHCMQARSPELPVEHVELQLIDLAAMVALRHAPSLVTSSTEIVDRLREPRQNSTAAAAVQQLVQRKRRLLRRERQFIGVAIGANKETKLWPHDAFVELCRRLLDQPNVDIVFLGGPSDSEQVRALIAELSAGGRTIDLTGCCRIEDLGEVLAKLDGFIGLDTGTTHFAGRVGLPTVAIFGASHDPLRWGPVGVRSSWAAADIACKECSKASASQCEIGVRCMSDISPEDVWRVVESTIFDRQGSSRNA
ncbi:glycosyltransferase family 9 protein [Sphingomonas sp. BIUV-7]|uniref:Glycosyltransferase family 9 protein n=1 Tax=Sphingomonas natans TaxID=3063330 RepID=A0ABT8Y5T2_9SPHN|nr:glycosyltransferase family 9 protein [Sphingomonas sp. BIUV-7]MDO6413680.1 glycosyltransferase family 9 protein [Sphingomonas sp. BIUV-7]